MLLLLLPLVLTAVPAIPSASELQANLDAAIAAGAATFAVPAGTYNFSTANFNVFGATHGLRLLAAGATALFHGTSGVNVTNCADLHVSGLTIDYASPEPHGRRGVPGITYNVWNSTRVTSEDVTILRAPFFAVTAFNGGGGHVFRRFRLPSGTADPGPCPYRHQRDAFHFSDLRQGVTLEDSDAADFGDDFFNSHNTIMLALAVEEEEEEGPAGQPRTSALLINPHLQNVRTGRNTVYGTNCVLENLRGGDRLTFFAPINGSSDISAAAAFAPVPRSGSCAVRGVTERVRDAAVLAAAAALGANFSRSYFTEDFDASDVWRVRFAAPLPAAVVAGSLVNVDSFSTPGTVIRNNTFTNTRYNLGRFKSAGGAIVNNSFSRAGAHNLEITPLLQYFEGPVLVRDVTVAGNTFAGVGATPVHCSPFCNPKTCPYGNCSKCPDCARDYSPWATNTTVRDNTFLEGPEAQRT